MRVRMALFLWGFISLYYPPEDAGGIIEGWQVGAGSPKGCVSGAIGKLLIVSHELGNVIILLPLKNVYTYEILE